MAAPKRRKRYSIVVTSDTRKLNANHLALYTPDLKQVVNEVTAGLQANFADVHVEIHDKCPKLNAFGNLPTEVHGICGNTRIAEVGGAPYLFSANHQKQSFSVTDICRAAGVQKGGQPLVFGAATPDPSVENKNGAVVVNLHGVLNNHSRLCVVSDKSGDASPLPMELESAKVSYKSDEDVADEQRKKRKSLEEETLKQTLQQLEEQKQQEQQQQQPQDNDVSLVTQQYTAKISDVARTYSSVTALMRTPWDKDVSLVTQQYTAQDIGCSANLFICDGTNEDAVLYVKVSKRTGALSIVEALRTALKNVKGVGKTTQIGVGGIIRVNKGKVKAYVSNADYVELDHNNQAAVDDTRQMFEIGPKLVIYTTFLTDDPSENNKYHLALQSAACYHWDEEKPHVRVDEGGVFVESATDDEIEYEAYFTLAKYVYRVEDAFYNLAMEKK
eukprot:CAMPEP_0202726104 /NCGR_PEP_ID=MMETSP1385-20130828/184442_1 /ASSEMBLY_ACC=CAM_ASM_000861 /TAXON_ID=933848 /ORGANISM="Elphidium margaritaceum" /LENGTH=443 /DNA_ID=CAMNT_0049392317 /DNA_START=67 /DNA_END=1399 /DNA_ORIENTATION=+